MMPPTARPNSLRVAVHAIRIYTIEGRDDLAYFALVSEVIKSAHVNMVIDGVSEMTLVIHDDGHKFLYDNFFPKGGIVSWKYSYTEEIQFIITGREASGFNEITVTARDRVAAKLRAIVGPLSVKDVSPPQAIATMVEGWTVGDKVSVQVMGEPMASIADCTLMGTETGVEPEDLWNGAERWSTEAVPPMGLMLFSARGRIWYARPSWLVDHMPSIVISPDSDVAKHALVDAPKFRDSVDSKWDEKTVELSVLMELGQELTTGTVLDLQGYGNNFSAKYWVTSADGDVADDAVWTIQAATPPTDEQYMLKLLGVVYNPYALTPQNQLINPDDGDQDIVLRTIREVESNNNYNEHHRFDDAGRNIDVYYDSASGAYQIVHRTWKSMGGSTEQAYQATIAEQDKVAKAYLDTMWSPGQDLRRVPKGWAGDPEAPDDMKLPGNNGGITFGQYADKWMAVYRRLSDEAGNGGSSTTAPIPTDGSADVSGFTPKFESALSKLFASAKTEKSYNYVVTSGYRTQAQQDKLFADAVKRYGSESAARHYVAKFSNHTKGVAADLGCKGVSLGYIDPRSGKPLVLMETEWIHGNAHRFGLNFPMSWEPWHIELNGTRSSGD